MNKHTTTIILSVLIVALIGIVVATLEAQHSYGGKIIPYTAQAPIAISSDNIYIALWANKTGTGIDEVMFRAFTDNRQAFVARSI